MCTLLITLNSAGILTVSSLKILNSLSYASDIIHEQISIHSKKIEKLRRIQSKKIKSFQIYIQLLFTFFLKNANDTNPLKDQPLFSHILPLPLFLISPFTTIYICIRLPFPLVADISGSSVNNQKGRGF